LPAKNELFVGGNGDAERQEIADKVNCSLPSWALQWYNHQASLFTLRNQNTTTQKTYTPESRDLALHGRTTDTVIQILKLE
jgi:hypothetical protein